MATYDIAINEAQREIIAQALAILQIAPRTTVPGFVVEGETLEELDMLVAMFQDKEGMITSDKGINGFCF